MRTAIAVLLACIAPAAAESPHTDVNGFVTYGPGELAGTVTDPDGTPLAGVRVQIAVGDRALSVTTDAKGKYKARIAVAGPVYVYVEHQATIVGQLAAAVKEGDHEAIAIRETLPPVVQPKAKIGLDVILDYSEAAEDKNAWTRAWLLLDVGETGTVLRVKLLDPPGMDLDAIAIREAFEIPFEPARDRAQNPVRALVLWTWEWPAYDWLIAQRRQRHRMPRNVARISCKGTAPTRALRDCRKPSVAKAMTLPWIDRPASPR